MKLIAAVCALCLLPQTVVALQVADQLPERRFPQFPSTPECLARVAQLAAQFAYMNAGTDWDHPLHWALTDGLKRDIAAWQAAARLNDPGVMTPEARDEALETLIESIGYDAFVHGWLPPVPDWRPPE